MNRAEVLTLLSQQPQIFGLQSAAVEIGSGVKSGKEARNKQTAKFLQQLELLDKDERISWEPFLFSVAACFHTVQPPTPKSLPQIEEESQPQQPPPQPRQEADTQPDH